MLKITIRKDMRPARLVLEGNLAGAWVQEARQVWLRFFRQRKGRRVVDLTSVSHVDPEGKLLLACMWKDGADLQAIGCYTKSLVQAIIAEAKAPP
jgi:hypothetical protein